LIFSLLHLFRCFYFNFQFYFNIIQPHPTMDPSSAQRISDHVNSKFDWKQDKLVFSLDIDGGNQVEFDVVPYLGRQGIKFSKVTSLHFPNPSMDQKEMIALFKQQALKQGVHLTTVASSSNSESYKGCFFKLACSRFRVHDDSKSKSKHSATQQPTMPGPLQLYNPNVKTGTLRTSRITRGLEGKRLPRRTETTKSKMRSQCCTFNFTFSLIQDIDSWVLSGGSGCCDHTFHPKAILGLTPTLRETPQRTKEEALEFFDAS
jgi:hypothetical protein